MADIDSLIPEFLTECFEHLDGIEALILQIEHSRGENCEKQLNKVLRAAHSIKGGSSLFGFKKIQQVSHCLESLLQLLRSKKLCFQTETAEVLLKGFDLLRTLLNNYRESESYDISAIAGAIDSISTGKSPSVLVETTQTIAPRPEASPQNKAEITPVSTKKEEIPPSLPSGSTDEPASEPTETTIRVKVNLLERLMNLASELVLSRNQLREAIANNDMYAIQTSGQRISAVTSELQEAIMTTRLQAIDRVFSKIPRLLRDLSREVNKDIALHIEGNDVELDKSLIEGLSDPLTHLIRNSVDHGIEPDDERIRLGKSIPSKIFLRARHEAGQVLIEIGDDGRGIDLEKVCQKALTLGLIQHDHVAKLSDAEKISFIFFPGFSTAPKVTTISGRGFGMDIVKTNIDRLGGKIDIESKPGAGTLFRIKLPLTLAIIPSLIIGAQKELFAIPQINVVELLRIPAEQVKHRIEVIGGREVLLLRDEFLPLIELTAFLEVPKKFAARASSEELEDRRNRLADRRSPCTDSPAPLRTSGSAPVLPIRSKGRRFASCSDITILVVTTGVFCYGIIVDEKMYSEEIVVKPLGKYLKPLSEYSGATILGNGQIALIFDLASLATRAQLAPISAKERKATAPEWAELRKETKLIPFLTFPCGGPERYALPLFMVLRIEKIRAEKIERFGGWATMPSGNRVLPILSLSDLFKAEPIRPDQEPVLIMTEIRGREVGILAAMPPEVIEIPPQFDVSVLRQTGIAGSAIARGTTLLMVDLWEIMQTTRPELLEFPERHPLLAGNSPHVLILDRHGFFRRHMRHFLEQAGFFVLESANREEAMRLLEEHSSSLQAIVADVDLLANDQFGLSRTIRTGKNGATIPIIALSVFGNENVDLLRKNGINSLQIKLDHFGLLGCLAQSTSGHQASLIQ